MALFEIQNFSFAYPKTQEPALKEISFSLEEGELFLLSGASGSGKTTLLRQLKPAIAPYGKRQGAVLYEGRPVEELEKRRAALEIGFVFQSPDAQIVTDRVSSELAFGLENAGVPPEEIRRRVAEMAGFFGIEGWYHKAIEALSGGQRQMLNLASVMVMNPKVLILDEPTSQLDPEGSDEVFKAVETLTGSGITILMIEQKIEKLAAYCDRILLLHKGKQIAFDTPQKVFSMPDLNDYGIQAPAFTRICKAEQVTLADGTYPVTVKEAAEVLREKRLGVYEHANAEAGVQKAVGASAAGTGQVQAKNAETGARSGQSGTCRKAENVASVDEQFRIEKLDFSYLADIPVLEDLNMKLDQRPTAIIGQNGAGKTTLVKLLKGLLKPVSGSIYFHGEDISGKTVAMLAGSVGYVFQNPDDQIFKYNVMDEVLFGPLNIGMDPEQAKKEAAWALELTGLSGKEKENPYDLELYERKMTAIASVLAMDTDVLILDEPTIAQDWKGRQIIGSIIRSLSGRGKLVIAILHDMDFVAENFERVIIMAHGQVLADGTAKEVFAQEEVLKKARLQKPYVMQLSEALGYEKSYLTVEELLKDRMSLCAAIKL